MVGSRKRVWYKTSGDQAKLIIRRLHCKTCKRIHHELPDVLVPYKRYDVESIEGVLNEPERTDIAADESTLFRWKAWFLAFAVYAAGALNSLSLRFGLPMASSFTRPSSALQSLGRFVGDASGWLSRVVRPIANSHLWITDPFCLSVRNLLK